MKKVLKSKVFLAFMFSLLLGFVIVLPNIIINRGIFVLSADYNYQQVLFGEVMNYSIKEGSFLWTWYNELGSNFIGTFSFYNLLSPFNLVSYLFPARWYPYLCGYLVIFKFGISGLTSYLFLSRYVKNKKYAIIGSVLYSFSGYQLNNLLFHFQDSICLFPLLLYTLDNLMYDGKKNRFCFIVFLLCITNWFMFIGQCVFICIYVVVKFLFKEYSFKNIGKFLFEFVIGILLSSFLLVPSLLFTASNPRMSSSWELKNIFFYPSSRYVEIIRSLFFPNEIMYPRAFLTDANFDSVEFYLPFVGFVLVIPYILKKPKSWLSVLVIVLLVFMFVPILNSSFFVFKTKYYARWFYMATLICSLTSIKTLEEKFKIGSGVIISILVLLFMFFVYFYLSNKYQDRVLIFDMDYVKLTIGFMVFNLLVLCVVFRLDINLRDKVLMVMICVFSSVWGNYTIYKYCESGNNYSDNYNKFINSYKYISFDESVRTNSINCPPNISDILMISNLRSFNTNINGSNFEFYNSIDYLRDVSTNIESSDILNNFLSVKYMIVCNNEINDSKYKLIDEQGIYKIYENKNYKDFGLVFNKYISVGDFNKLQTEDKKQVLINRIVLTDDQIDGYGYLYNGNVKVNSNLFEFIENGFTSSINISDETLILYTIPYDSGWTATNNGQVVDILNVDNGLMAIKGVKGENKVVFKYFPSGLKSGIIVSLVSFSILLFKVFKGREKNC